MKTKDLIKRIKIFFDTEFTGLRKDTNLISIGLVSEDNKTFYWECSDYEVSQISEWLKENVVNKLIYNKDFVKEENGNITGSGSKKELKDVLSNWFKQFNDVEMWADVSHYDWVLFCDIFGDAFSIPKNVYYICFDLATLMLAKGIDPDINREKFSELSGEHNALDDAKMAKNIYHKLNQ